MKRKLQNDMKNKNYTKKEIGLRTKDKQITNSFCLKDFLQ